ncbi:hypothetical protein GCM10022240_00190 [Microbacterium kribbense]|uniref:Glycosyltransferase involved in cell wall biosynthesis n=1 Tax=Microbacterium kribbense TaxID=433645 RepID=A0ABP7G0X3_9MICO
MVFSLEPWDGVWRRNQYLVDGLLRADDSLRVLFIEPGRDVVNDALNGRRPRTGAGLRTVPGYDARLTLFQPTKWMPRVAGPFADGMLRAGVRRAMRRTGVRQPVLWINDPNWASLVEPSGAPALYDMTDDWIAAERPHREHDRLVANERRLLERCAAVVVCSSALLQSRRGARPDAVLVPNAVDVARYRTPADRPADASRRRYAVYVGTLHEDRLDVDLVVDCGRRLAQFGAEVLLVGPDALTAANSRRLRTAPGVSLLGAREYLAVPAYLQHAHTLIVPHVVTAFTDSLDPIKLYEYLAVGRPIVSTPVAGFRDFDGRGGVEIVAAPAFADRLADAMARPVTDMAPTEVPDWSVRVGQMAAVIDAMSHIAQSHSR